MLRPPRRSRGEFVPFPPLRPRPVRVALAQMDCVVGDVPANAAKIARFAAEARAEGCDVLFLPELADTGYVMDAVREHAGAWPGPAFEAVRAAAGEHGIAIVCGLAERVGPTLHNSLAAFDAGGTLVAKYRKTHLFNGAADGEPATFAAGDELVTADLAGRRWGLSICYDLRFPEVYSGLTHRGATALVNCSAWPDRRGEHWELLARARAVENQAFFVGCNRVGTDAGLTFAGRSRVVAPTGELLAEAPPDREELLIAELDFAAVGAFRDLLPALAARRPDRYADWAAAGDAAGGAVG